MAELRRAHAAGVVDLVAAGSEWYCAVLAPYRSLVREGVNIAMEPHRVQEYDAYRLARFLQVREYTPLDVLVDRARDAVQRPVLIILLSYPTLFEFESPELKAVRFVLDQQQGGGEVLTHADLDGVFKEMAAIMEERRLCNLEPKAERKYKFRRVNEDCAMRLGSKLASVYRFLKPSPYADRKVTAYALFDLLPQHPLSSSQAIMLLTQEARSVCHGHHQDIPRVPSAFLPLPAEPSWMAGAAVGLAKARREACQRLLPRRSRTVRTRRAASG